jgi:DNA-directed RNA polymerase subunit RPC12/RpoP
MFSASPGSAMAARPAADAEIAALAGIGATTSLGGAAGGNEMEALAGMSAADYQPVSKQSRRSRRSSRSLDNVLDDLDFLKEDRGLGVADSAATSGGRQAAKKSSRSSISAATAVKGTCPECSETFVVDMPESISEALVDCPQCGQRALLQR